MLNENENFKKENDIIDNINLKVFALMDALDTFKDNLFRIESLNNSDVLELYNRLEEETENIEQKTSELEEALNFENNIN